MSRPGQPEGLDSVVRLGEGDETCRLNMRSVGRNPVPLADVADDYLAALWFHAAAELQRRRVKLWHIGDFVEILVARKLRGTRATSNVQAGYDVELRDRTRVQVKALVNRPGNVRTSVGYFTPGTYDLAVVARFSETLGEVDAWTFGPDVVEDYARWHEDRRAFRLTLTQKLTRDPRVQPLTLEIPAPPPAP